MYDTFATHTNASSSTNAMNSNSLSQTYTHRHIHLCALYRHKKAFSARALQLRGLPMEMGFYNYLLSQTQRERTNAKLV